MRLKDQPWLTTDQPHWYETFVRDDRCRLSGTGKISYDLNKRSASLKCSSGWKLNLVVCRRLTHADGLKAQSGHDEQLRLGTAWQAYSLPREDRRPLVISLSCSEGCKSWVWCHMAALESLKRPVETWAYWRCQDHGMTAWDWAELCELWMAEQESQGYAMVLSAHQMSDTDLSRCWSLLLFWSDCNSALVLPLKQEGM